MAQGRILRSAALAVLLLASACSHAPPPASESAPNEWHTFKGNWIATGTRNTIPLGETRRATIADIEGTMLLSGDKLQARAAHDAVFHDRVLDRWDCLDFLSRQVIVR